jgi:hypothetical protein
MAGAPGINATATAGLVVLAVITVRQHVDYIRHHELELWFEDGTKSKLLFRPETLDNVFEPLKDVEFFWSGPQK